jgi:hypothetical protein
MQPNPETPTTYIGLVGIIVDIIGLLVIALFAFSFVYFIWKMVDCWVLNAGEPTKREDGKKYALSAVIALVVMVSVWGIVAMLRASVFGDPGGA